jgi:hypothetical protein
MTRISPCSNPDESALPKCLIGFDHSIEIWLSEVPQVSWRPAVPRGNNFTKRKGGQRNVVQLVREQCQLMLGKGSCAGIMS